MTTPHPLRIEALEILDWLSPHPSVATVIAVAETGSLKDLAVAMNRMLGDPRLKAPAMHRLAREWLAAYNAEVRRINEVATEQAV